MTYYIQPKAKPFKQSVNIHTTKLVSIFLLGRQVSQYIVIKSDDKGDRIVTFTEFTVNSIEAACDAA